MSGRFFWKCLALTCVGFGVLIEADTAPASNHTNQPFLTSEEGEDLAISIASDRLDQLFENGAATNPEITELLRAALSANWFLFAEPLDYGALREDFQRSHSEGSLTLLPMSASNCEQCDPGRVELWRIDLGDANFSSISSSPASRETRLEGELSIPIYAY